MNLHYHLRTSGRVWCTNLSAADMLFTFCKAQSWWIFASSLFINLVILETIFNLSDHCFCMSPLPHLDPWISLMLNKMGGSDCSEQLFAFGTSLSASVLFMIRLTPVNVITTWRLKTGLSQYTYSCRTGAPDSDFLHFLFSLFHPAFHRKVSFGNLSCHLSFCLECWRSYRLSRVI